MWDWKHNCHDNVLAVLQELFRVDVELDFEGVRTRGRKVVSPKVAWPRGVWGHAPPENLLI